MAQDRVVTPINSVSNLASYTNNYCLTLRNFHMGYMKVKPQKPNKEPLWEKNPNPNR